MKVLGKNTLTIIVAFALLIGSSGFQVYKHSCATHNFSAVSLIEIPVCEKDHQLAEVLDDCCKTEEKETNESNCCESKPFDQSTPYSISSSDIKCCISTFEYLQLQDNIFQPLGKKKISVEVITYSISFIEEKNVNLFQPLIVEQNNLPPPVFGKLLLTSIHQLKLDTPFC